MTPTSRVVPVGGEYAVEVETDTQSMRWGPYPTRLDAETVLAHVVAALAGVTGRRGGYVPAGAPVPRPVQETLL